MRLFEITGGATRSRPVVTGGGRQTSGRLRSGLVRRAAPMAVVVLAVLLSGCNGRGDDSSGIGTETVTTMSTPPPAGDTSTPASTSRTVPAEPMLVLRHDGLGPVTFGQPVDTVMDVLEGLLGPPDFEEIQISPDVDRSVQWDDPFLYLQFTSPDHFNVVNRPGADLDGPLFHYYLTTSDRFATAAGITTASTVAELEKAYPGIVFHQTCGGPEWEFVVDPSGDWPRLPLFGLLDGEPDNPESPIIYVGAGLDRTPC